MATTYDVRIWKIREHVSTKKKADSKPKVTYSLRWVVAKRTLCQTFDNKAMAESFRAQLVIAKSRGEAFDTTSGLPVSIAREQREKVTFYNNAIAFTDLKWPHLAPGSRRTLAESLATTTSALVRSAKGKPDASDLYGALVHWAFNRPIREASEGKPPEKYADAIEWIEANSIPLSALMDPGTVRTAYNSITIKPDGSKYAPDTFTRKRTVLTGAVKHAIEAGLLDTNPLEQVRPEAPRKSKNIDRRSVVNIDQARALIAVIGNQGPSGPQLVAFFAVLYFAGLRPSEAIDLRVDNCFLPKSGWGELVFANANPYSGSEWTDNHQARQRKELKHRAVDEARHTPACPELVAHLRRHIAEFGAAPDGRIFQSLSGDVLSQGTYDRIWKKARTAALTKAQVASPLGLRPYDLRHACVSTWLNAGVHAPLVAEWAGHSVEVLLSTYAKCIHGQEDAARKRIADALGGMNANATEDTSERDEAEDDAA